MEGLLHWDFAPRLALADQVRRKFGSTVHFSPSRDTKEFFLVVTFSSALFPLSIDSVGTALQCCIGGFGEGFNVLQIGPRAFRFSMANNKVGHFIYRLKDRIWPDFVCHFHIFNGHYARFAHQNSSWHADEELKDISARKPIAIKSNLGSLQNGASLHPSYLRELSKFELVSIPNMAFSNSHHDEASSSSLENIHSPVHRDHGTSSLKFGTIQMSNNETASITASNRRKQLMAQYKRQAVLEESVSPSYLILGSFKCIIRQDYPPPPQCFLASALKYAPPHPD